MLNILRKVSLLFNDLKRNVNFYRYTLLDFFFLFGRSAYFIHYSRSKANGSKIQLGAIPIHSLET